MLVSNRRVLRGLLLFFAAYVLVSLVALALSDDVAAAVSRASPRFFLFFLAAVLTGFALRLLRWFYLTRGAGLHLSRRIAAQCYIGGFCMTLTPGRVGELWRVWVLSRHARVHYGRALPPVLCDRLLDLNALLLFAGIGFFLSAEYRVAAAAAFVIFLPPLLLFLLKPLWLRRIVKILWALTGGRLTRFFAALLAAARHVAVIARRRVYLPALLLSLLAWGAEAFAVTLALAELRGVLPLPAAMALLGLGNMAGVLTVLPGGVIGQEVTMTYLLQAAGNTFAVAAAAVVFIRVGTLFLSAFIGLPFFYRLSEQTAAISGGREYGKTPRP